MKIFISHATEDKDKVARPLAKALRKLGYEIWYDEYSLKLGDSLTAEIDRGLIECEYGVVIFSKSFFAKRWPQRELAGLVSRETSPSTGKTIILPVWHDINAEEIRQYSPTLADRIAVSTSSGTKKIVDEIIRAVGGQEKKSKLLDYKSLDQIQETNVTVQIPSLAAWTISSRANMLSKGALRRLRDKKYYWSPDIEDLVKRANYGNSQDLWNYMYFSYRTIYVNEIIDDSVCNLTIALMIYLDKVNSKLPIHLYISTLGGQVYNSIGIYDIMRTISAPIYTYGIDTVAGSGCFLLAAGRKGYRFSTKETKIIHTPLEGSKSHTATDEEIQEKQLIRLQGIIHKITAEHTNIHPSAIAKDFSIKKTLTVEEANQYGFIDKVLFSKSLLPPWKWGYERSESHMHAYF